MVPTSFVKGAEYFMERVQEIRPFTRLFLCPRVTPRPHRIPGHTRSGLHLARHLERGDQGLSEFRIINPIPFLVMRTH